MRTHQLRRYEIASGKMSEFASWMESTLIPVREGFGYQIEFKLIDPENSQYVWCVSVEGSQENFLAVQAAYSESAERAKAFETFPNCIDAMHISFVDALDLPK